MPKGARRSQGKNTKERVRGSSFRPSIILAPFGDCAAFPSRDSTSRRRPRMLDAADAGKGGGERAEIVRTKEENAKGEVVAEEEGDRSDETKQPLLSSSS